MLVSSTISATYPVYIRMYESYKYLRALESNYCCNIQNTIIIPGATPQTLLQSFCIKICTAQSFVCLMLETAQVNKNTIAIIEMSQHTYEHEVLLNF